MYVGGAFSGTADGTVTLNRIARYDLNTNVWSTLANNGLNSPVYALAASGDDLYVGGMFTQTFDGAVTLRRIARYSLSNNTWNPLSNNGLTGGEYLFRVEDLAVGSDLYVGGDFSQTTDGTITLNYIARYYLSTAEPAALPETGFQPGVISSLPTQPEEKVFATYGDMWIEIPRLGVELPIVGVPLVKGEWDVSWLGGQTGYLEGTAFPTWPGNTAITAHVWDAINTPGPFVNLKQLAYGDEVRIYAWGQVYTYEVRDSYLAYPSSLSPLRHEEFDWISLITCERYSYLSDTYRFRRVVRAVLMSVTSE
jgi:LPXTG-site transpeptidase (sortase) family protein